MPTLPSRQIVYSILLLGFAMTLWACQPSETDPEPEEPTARIVFFGDSITQAGVEPDGYVTLIADSLDEAGVEVIGAGISGNKVPDLLQRVDDDVLAHEPTHVVIYIGINDVWHWFRFDPLGTEMPVFEAGLRDLIEQIETADAEVILCTPSVIGEDPAFETEEDQMLERYAGVSRRVAEETGATLCDLRMAFRTYLETHNPDGQTEGVLTSDGVHLNEAGNRFVAAEMLEVLRPMIMD